MCLMAVACHYCNVLIIRSHDRVENEIQRQVAGKLIHVLTNRVAVKHPDATCRICNQIVVRVYRLMPGHAGHEHLARAGEAGQVGWLDDPHGDHKVIVEHGPIDAYRRTPGGVAPLHV